MLKLDPKKVKELVAFIRERYAIYERRRMGQPKPWTKDTILQQYRFCNVFREHDTVTRWIAENYVRPHEGDDRLWFALLVARSFNEPNTLLYIGYPVPWNAHEVRKALNKLADSGLRIFNSAYNTPHCIGVRGAPKHLSICDKLFTPLWFTEQEVSEAIQVCATLQEVHTVLRAQWAVGSFMAAQIVADLKYAPRWKHAEDWWTFVAPGPGSLRGMSRLTGVEKISEEDFLAVFSELRGAVAAALYKKLSMKLDAQNLQNCLCEFDKYCRVKYGEGRPKSRYNGA